MKSKLSKLSKTLKDLKHNSINYAIPDLWFSEDLNIQHTKLKNHEILVNPYDYFISLIDNYILPNKKDDVDYSKSISLAYKERCDNGEWIKKSIIYSSHVRTSASYDNDRSMSLDISNLDDLCETGSFVKMLSLLPLLKKLGVNALYLLPISMYSKINKKGELGSPYSVSSFTKLDPSLKDSLTKKRMTVDEEFMAFIEACHIMGIRILIDIIPRTNSIGSELILSHPEWFYWIKTKNKDKYRPPKIEKLGELSYPTLENMKIVYETKEVIDFIKLFEMNPKEKDEELWKTISGNTIDEKIEDINKKFGLSVAPAFSDCINDPQDPWSDVTFFRLYLDDPKETRSFLKIKHNPYILFDSIKTNIYSGDIKNQELWDLLSSIIPYYQKRFGIDGARIDMGHALPKELLKDIITKARKIDKSFTFIAEEMNMGNDKDVKKAMYNAMIGNGFYTLPRIKEGEFKNFILNSTKVALPLLSCLETHDTRRVAFREGGEKLSLFLTILSYFIPNTIPFINSGQEIYEKEPMNLGVDANLSDFEALPKDDIFYHKLALFDKYQFHYNNPKSHEIIDHLKDPLKVREKWLNIITDPKSYLRLRFEDEKDNLVGISYLNPKKNRALLIIANGDYNNKIQTKILLGELREKINNYNNIGNIRYATYELPRIHYDFIDSNMILELKPLEVKIIEI